MHLALHRHQTTPAPPRLQRILLQALLRRLLQAWPFRHPRHLRPHTTDWSRATWPSSSERCVGVCARRHLTQPNSIVQLKRHEHAAQHCDCALAVLEDGHVGSNSPSVQPPPGKLLLDCGGRAIAPQPLYIAGSEGHQAHRYRSSAVVLGCARHQNIGAHQAALKFRIPLSKPFELQQ